MTTAMRMMMIIRAECCIIHPALWRDAGTRSDGVREGEKVGEGGKEEMRRAHGGMSQHEEDGERRTHA